MGATFARAMLPACFPDRPGDPERRNTKNELKKVFEPDDDNDISQFSEDTAWTCSDASFHTPNGTTPAHTPAAARDTSDRNASLVGVDESTRSIIPAVALSREREIEYTSWPEPENKEGIKAEAVHGEISSVTKDLVSPCPGSRFKLRIGPDYCRNKKKAHSGPALYNLRAVDMLDNDRKIPHISRFFDRTKTQLDEKEDVMEGDIINGIPRFFIATYMLPSYSPSMSLFNPKTDGHGYTVVFLFVLSKHGLEASMQQTGAYRVLRSFCEMPCNVSDKVRGPNLWKNIVSVANFKDLGLNYYLTRYIRNYNAKPWLSRNADMHTFKGRDYFEVDLDIHVYNFIGLRFMFELKTSLSKLVLDIGFVVQSEADDEMPETILGCGRLSNVNYDRDCTKVDWHRYASSEPVTPVKNGDKNGGGGTSSKTNDLDNK